MRVKLTVVNEKARVRKWALRTLDDESGRWVTYRHPAVDQLNAEWLKGDLSYEDAWNRLNNLANELRQSQPLYVNSPLLETYFKEKYATRRHPATPNTLRNVKNDITNLMKVLEPLDLRTVPLPVLEAKLYDSDASPSMRRTLVIRCNAVLRWLGRDKLEAPPRSQNRVELVPEWWVKRLSQLAPIPWKWFYLTAYYTGLRDGELFGLEHTDFDPITNTLWVRRQVLRDGTVTLPKVGKVRRTIVMPAGRDALVQWLDVPDRVKLRTTSQPTRIMRRVAARNKLPNDHTVHSLRHSFAINCLSKGMSLSVVAKLLGNTESVAERYYIGFSMPDEILVMANKLVNPPQTPDS